jgi:hypothetical protein
VELVVVVPLADVEVLLALFDSLDEVFSAVFVLDVPLEPAAARAAARESVR